MRKLFLPAMIFLLFSCNSGTENKVAVPIKDTTDKKQEVVVNFPYTAAYSSSFVIGDQQMMSKVLQGCWKDWENNNLDGLKNVLADTVTLNYGDNSSFTGTKQEMIDSWKTQRERYSSIIDSVHAWVPLYSLDKKENWALIWATEYTTDGEGRRDTTNIQDTWRINKDGKVDMLLQYWRKARN